MNTQVIIHRITHVAEATTVGAFYLLPSGAIAQWTGNRFRHIGWLSELTRPIPRQRTGD